MPSTKTIALTESVYERLKQAKERERAESFSEAVAKLLERAAGVPASKFGVHKRSKLRLTQEEHEGITRDVH